MKDRKENRLEEECLTWAISVLAQITIYVEDGRPVRATMYVRDRHSYLRRPW